MNRVNEVTRRPLERLTISSLGAQHPVQRGGIDDLCQLQIETDAPRRRHREALVDATREHDQGRPPDAERRRQRERGSVAHRRARDEHVDVERA
ncbi:MAG TPA: hypothetical protein VIF62_39610, partial [Labilithrix sp.]